MPLSKVVSGLIFYDDFSILDGWMFVNNSAIDPIYGEAGGGSVGLGIQSTGTPQDATSIETESIGFGNGLANGGEGWYQREIDVGSGVGRQVHIYVNANPIAGYSFARGLETPTLTLYNNGVNSTNGFVHAYATITDGGVVLAKVAHTWASPYSTGAYVQVWVTSLVVCTSNLLILTGLLGGQKVELYEQGNGSPVVAATVPADSSSVIIDLTNIIFPGTYYFKIYSTSGVLIDTTDPYLVCGGDTWVWTAPTIGLIVQASGFTIYSVDPSNPGTPKTATVTAKLYDVGGNPYGGATIQFASTLGTLSAKAAATDATGRTSVTLSSGQAGIAVVTAIWGGDPNNPNVPAATGFIQIHIFSSVETPDSTKPFQFFCEGQEYVFVDGTYTLAANGVVGNFEVDLPAWQPTVTMLGFCSFYRFGVKEFTGILTRVERRLSDSPTVKLIGVDASWLLNTRVIDHDVYGETPQTVLAQLLTRYGGIITPGNINLPTTTAITITFNTVQLLSAIQQVLATIQGSQYRVNANLTLDASDALGENSAALFSESGAGSVLASPSSLTEDVSLISNNMHVGGGGKPRITSLAADFASIAVFGLIEGTDLQPSITHQPTLDLLAAYEAARNGFAGETVQLDMLDMYPTGTYGLYDYVTVISPTLGLSGLYQVMQFTRTTLTNPHVTQLQLGARAPEVWEMDEPGKRITAQLGGLVTPLAGPSLAVDNVTSGAGSASLTHSANVVVIIFIADASSGVSSVTVGGVAAAAVIENTGSEGFLFAYSVTRTTAGTEQVVVSPGYRFIAVSIKNSTTNVVDSAVGGLSEQSPIRTSQVTINAGTPRRLVLVACNIFEGGSTQTTLDNQLTQVANYVDAALHVGGLIQDDSSILTFTNSGDTGSTGWIASIAVAIKP